MSDVTTDVMAADLLREVKAVLGRRIDLLERENQQMKRTGMIVAALLAVLLVLASVVLISTRVAQGGVAEVVESQSFLLRDDNGHVRAALGFSADGAPRIVLQDRDGRERLRLSLLADGSPGASFTDREGRSRAVLGLLPDETATLVFADRTGKTRTVLGLSPDESSTLVFADRNGETRVGLGVEPDGAAGLTIFERDAPRAAPAVEQPPEGETTGAAAEQASPARTPTRPR